MTAGLWLAQRGSACLHCERVLAAILSSQLRAGPQGEQVVSRAWAARRYQTMSGGGLTSSSAVKNRLGKTCCQSMFAANLLPGPQKSPKEAGAFDGCLPDLLPSLLPAWPGAASSHASPAPSVCSACSEAGLASCPLPVAAARGDSGREEQADKSLSHLASGQGGSGTPAAPSPLGAVGTAPSAGTPPHALASSLSLTCQSSCLSPVENRQTPKVKGTGEVGCAGLRLQCSQREQTSQPTERGGAMGEATLPSGATMLQSRACVRVMAGLGTGRWLALDIRLYRDNTERGFTCSKWFSFSFQGLRSGGEVGLLGYSVCACVRVCVRACVCACAFPFTGTRSPRLAGEAGKGEAAGATKCSGSRG